MPIARRAIAHLSLPLCLLALGGPLGVIGWSIATGADGSRGALTLGGWLIGTPLVGVLLLVLLAPLAIRLEVLRRAYPDALVLPVRTQHQDWLALRPVPSRPRHWFRSTTVVSVDAFGITFWGGSFRPTPTCEVPWSAISGVRPGSVDGDDGSRDEHGLVLHLHEGSGTGIGLAPAHDGRFRFGLKHGSPDAAGRLRKDLEERRMVHSESSSTLWQRPDPLQSRADASSARAVVRWHGAPILATPWAVGGMLLGMAWATGPIALILLAGGVWKWAGAAALFLVVLWQGCLLALLLATRWGVRDGAIVVRGAHGWTRLPTADVVAIDVVGGHSLPAQLWLGIGARVWFGLEARLGDGSAVALPELFGSPRRVIAMADALEARLPRS